MNRIVGRVEAKWGRLRRAPYVSTREYLRARAEGSDRIEGEYFSTLRLPGGVFKSTQAHRMDDALELLAKHLPSALGRPLRTLDVACSSGVSTLELHSRLEGAGFECETVGTDLVLEVLLVEDETGAGLLLDASGHPLRVELPHASLPWPPPRFDLAFRPLRVARATRYVWGTLAAARSALSGSTSGCRVTRVPLTTGAIDGVAGVSLEQESIDRPRVEGRFDVVRAANILNRDYFAEPDLQRMLARLVERVADGGLLLVLRTGAADRVNRGTLLRRTSGRPVVVERLNGGSEVESLALRSTADTSSR